MTSPLFSRSLIDAAGVGDRSTFDFAVLTRILKAIEARLNPLEAQSGSLDAAIEAIRKVGLDRINEVLVPAIQMILDIQSKGYLIANSSTSATLANGNILTLTIDDEDQRRLFTPSPFVALTRAATPDDYAILRTVAYTEQDGKYIGEVLSFEGSAGPHGDWVLGALAGSTIAGLSALNRALTARNEAVAAAAAAVPAAAVATAKADLATEKAALAVAAAAAAATFDPSSYYSKAQVDSAIAAEATARGTAVSNEATVRANAVSAEATARADADAALLAMVNGKVAKLAWSKKTASFAAVAGNNYLLKHTAAATVTFPATVAEGDRIGLIIEDEAETYAVTIAFSGKSFGGAATDVAIKRGVTLIFEYFDNAWRIAA